MKIYCVFLATITILTKYCYVQPPAYNKPLPRMVDEDFYLRIGRDTILGIRVYAFDSLPSSSKLYLRKSPSLWEYVSPEGKVLESGRFRFDSCVRKRGLHYSKYYQKREGWNYAYP